MKKDNISAPNVLEMIPKKNIEFEQVDGKIQLLEPRFKSQFTQKYIARFFKKQTFFIHLDDFGSYTWNCIDGEKSVIEIAVQLKEHFGDSIEPVFERLGLFINMLVQRNYVKLLMQNEP